MARRAGNRQPATDLHNAIPPDENWIPIPITQRPTQPFANVLPDLLGAAAYLAGRLQSETVAY